MRYLLLITILVLAGAGVLMAPRADALTISPAKTDLESDPGKRISGRLKLLNETEKATTYYSSFANFEASGETGNPNFVDSKEGLASWMQTTESVTLAPDEEILITYFIDIPADASPGGHFGAIFWGTSPPVSSDSGQVSIAAKVGALVMLRVSGDIEEGGSILEFGADEGKKIFTSLPITFVYRFQNGGSDRINPTGEIKIKNMIGMTSAKLEANKSQGNILPQSIRKFTVVWDRIEEDRKKSAEDENEKQYEGILEGFSKEWNNFGFGRYSAKLELTFGTQGEVVRESFSFFVLPWRILTTVFIILILLFLLFKIAIKKYNTWIIAKARRLQGK